MPQPVRDRSLPIDHAAFVASEPATGRVIIIAPTRAACETIELAVGLHIETYLERTHGERVRELARSGKGFGIIAGTGTGKTLAIRPIAEEILKAPLKVGVVNREREATPELPHLNVIVVTTGIARRWFQDGDILPHDTLIIDEIHQTSAELELCLALGKRVGCRYIWLSATVDPEFYSKYLNSSDVLQVFSFDPEKAAEVEVVDKEPSLFLDDRFVRQVIRQKRGVGVFLPTRAGVEQAALDVSTRFPDLTIAFYHGGEPVRTIRPFLEDEGAEKPYILVMTAAGQSALNVRGLDTVVIDDTRFSNLIDQGRNVLTRLHLGSNEILQMAGRVHGRVAGGRVFILSNRNINFQALRPVAPEFQLAGDSERVALTCADLGVRADELELPVRLDTASYRRALASLQKRGIINEAGRLTTYGKAIEALPVDRPWAELLVNADKDLVPYLAVMSSIESLHRMTRDERDIDGLIIPGSDHLTAYNLYAEAYQKAGFIGLVYGLPRHLFHAETLEAWAEERGVLTKAIEDAALSTASIFRGLGMPLPEQMPVANFSIFQRFANLLAQYMPFDLVIDEVTAEGRSARVSRTSVCGGQGAIVGELRYFSDRFGVPRAAIEGTHIPLDRLRRYARREAPEIVYESRRSPAALVLKRQVEYFGFILDMETETLSDIPAEYIPQARRALAEALARFEAKHSTMHKNRAAIDQLREMYKRSGGETPRMNFPDLVALYEEKLNTENVSSLKAFHKADLEIRPNDYISKERRKELWALPTSIEIQEREVGIEYDVEAPNSPSGKPLGIARLQLPEKLARTLTRKELPKLDRPLRFEVSRGSLGAVRAATLGELQEKLEGPWRPDKIGSPSERQEPNLSETQAESYARQNKPGVRRKPLPPGRRPGGGARHGGRGKGRR